MKVPSPPPPMNNATSRSFFARGVIARGRVRGTGVGEDESSRRALLSQHTHTHTRKSACFSSSTFTGGAVMGFCVLGGRGVLEKERCFVWCAERDPRRGGGPELTRGVVAQKELLQLGARGGARRPSRLLEPFRSSVVSPLVLHLLRFFFF